MVTPVKDLDSIELADSLEFHKAAPYIVTICSGKGGVGKSLLAANIAYALSQENLSVLLWDADKYFPNQHFLFGVEPPVRLTDVYHGHLPLKNALFKLSENLSLLADLPSPPSIEHYQCVEIINCYKQIITDTDFDIVVIDTPAGASYEVFDCCGLSDLSCIVITDEPTSLLDAYALIKILLQQNAVEKFAVLVNNVIDWEDADDITQKLNLATEKFLDVTLETLGFVPYARTVRNSILSQELYLMTYPESEVGKAITEISKKILEKFNIYNEKEVVSGSELIV
jgi:flagellar biosynthesis protein FlhG